MQKRKLDIQHSTSELNAIIKEANKSFAEVLIAHSLTFDEKNFVAAKLFKDFDELSKESKDFYYSIIKQVNDNIPFVKEKEPEISLGVADQINEIEEYENKEVKDCFICGKSFTVNHFKEKGNYQGVYGYDEPFPSYYKTYCETCNSKYRALKKKASDTAYKFEKELLSKIRSAIKRDCKTLSIRKGNTSVWDIEISPIIKDHNYRSFNDEELKTLVKFRIFDSMENKTSSANIEDLYYFYLTRKDLIEPQKRTIAKGKISTNGKVSIQTNESKQGIEIVFTNKPERTVLSKLKAFGFHWSNRNKLWYIKQSSLTIEGENFINSLT